MQLQVRKGDTILYTKVLLPGSLSIGRTICGLAENVLKFQIDLLEQDNCTKKTVPVCSFFADDSLTALLEGETLHLSQYGISFASINRTSIAIFDVKDRGKCLD